MWMEAIPVILQSEVTTGMCLLQIAVFSIGIACQHYSHRSKHISNKQGSPHVCCPPALLLLLLLLLQSRGQQQQQQQQPPSERYTNRLLRAFLGSPTCLEAIQQVHNASIEELAGESWWYVT
jgi:hypothetical protein